MKKILLTLLVLSSVLFTGCDAFRRIAGRPTKSEIEAMRTEIETQLRLENQAKADSLARMEKAIADSLAVMDSLKQMKGTVLNPASLGGLFTTKLLYKYYIVVGAFSRRGNAESLVNTVTDKGYTAVLASFRNGLNAVCICQTNNVVEAFSSLKKVRMEPFCPDDVWILVNE